MMLRRKSIRETFSEGIEPMTGAEEFFKNYHRDPDGTVFCPYRICPIGAHSDHNLGKVTGFAIDKGISFSYGVKKNGVIEVSSMQFPKRAQWHIRDIPGRKANDWADYLRGATLAFSKNHALHYGLCGVLDGSIPIGGLSSSAAVTLAFLSALCKVNNVAASRGELIDMALEAERDYVGVSVGKLDQSCEVLGKKDCLLYLDTLDGSYELIPADPEMRPFRFAVFFSGLGRSLKASRYNTRVDELRAGVYALQAFSGMEYGSFSEANARNVPYEIYQRYKNKLPPSWARRCEHWYTEFQRVEAGAAAWRRGDIEEYGRLSFESGRSSIINWESGVEEQIRLYEIIRQTDGVYGGRFAGAGFRGCCIALIDPEYEERIIESVSNAYLKDFPSLREKYSVYICESADGVQL